MSKNREKIKVLHVIESLACGGAERMLVTTLANLNKEKFHNSVAYLYDNTYFLADIEKLGINVYPIHIKNAYHALPALSRISGIIKKEDVDIVHTNLFGADIYGRIAGKLANARCVVTTLHNLVYESRDSFRNSLFFHRRRILDAITGRLFNKAFIAVSDAVKNSAQRTLGFKNVNLIYNSIDMNVFSPLSDEEKRKVREALSLKQDTFVIVTAGRLDAQKGHIFLLEALSDPRLKVADIKLLILGEGCLEKELKDLAENLGIREKVMFMGYRKDARNVVGCADAFILPTISEGFGLSLLEAMALKVPCIASRTGGVSEIIESGIDGLLVDPAQADLLAGAISELLSDPVRRRSIALNSYNKIAENFDIKKNVKMLEELYEGCL